MSAPFGAYGAWFTAGSPDRLRAAALRRAFPPSILDEVMRGASPGYVTLSTRSGIAVLYIRARFAADFRELMSALRRRADAQGLRLFTFDTTEAAAGVLARMPGGFTR